MLGRDVEDLLRFRFDGAESPIARTMEWGVRSLGVPCTFQPNGLPEARRATLDVFPAYDDDGGFLVALTPIRGA